MNDQQVFETLFPEPHPLADSDRASMRSDLFGTVGTIPHRVAPDEDRAIDDTSAALVDDFELSARADIDTRRDAGSGRRWLTVAAAAVVIAGIAGVWAAGSRNGGEAPAPAQQPTTSSAPASELTIVPSEPTTTVPTGRLSAEPTAFPVLDELPAGLSATTHVQRMGDGWTSPRTKALIGRRVDGVLTAAVQLEVWPEPTDISPMQGRTPTEAVIMGQPASVHDISNSGGPPLFLVTWGSGPYFVASGEAPLTLLDQANPDAINATNSAGADAPPQLNIGALPGDFEVVVPPHQITGDATVFATLSIGADNYDISVHTDNPLVGMASAGHPLRSVEVNGQPGWTYLSSAPTQDITWQVDESTYAYLKINDGSTAADALALANKITFVDFDTWTTRYSPNITDTPVTAPPGDS
jgi:hypothetical protein